MLTLRLGEPVPAGARYVAAIGNFDGVHLGHAYLLRQMTEAADRQGLQSLAITFWPHPREVLHPASWPGYLATLPERSALLAALGLDALLVVPFTPELAGRSPGEFVDLLAEALPLVELWVGEDFRFGHGRAGDVAELRRLTAPRGIGVREIARLNGAGNASIGSNAIRERLQAGEVAAAARLLGRPYRLGGTVVTGDRRGRELGYPTANLQPDRGKVVPGRAIYAAPAQVGEMTYLAAVSIGIRPQFGGERELVEAYLLDFSGDLYGRRLELDFLGHLRAEQRFDSVAALIEQIGRDVARVRELGRSRPP